MALCVQVWWVAQRIKIKMITNYETIFYKIDHGYEVFWPFQKSTVRHYANLPIIMFQMCSKRRFGIYILAARHAGTGLLMG